MKKLIKLTIILAILIQAAGQGYALRPMAAANSKVNSAGEAELLMDFRATMLRCKGELSQFSKSNHFEWVLPTPDFSFDDIWHGVLFEITPSNVIFNKRMLISQVQKSHRDVEDIFWDAYGQWYMKKLAAYSNKIIGDGSGEHYSDKEFDKRILQARGFLKKAKIDVNGKSVLDVGTGPGSVACAAALEGSARVCGMDVSLRSLSLAQGKAERRSLKVSYFPGSVIALSDIETDFDIILAVNVLSFLPPALRIRALKQIHEKLPENGQFFMYEDFRFQDVEWNEDDWREALVKAGFKLADIWSKLEGGWIPAGVMLKAAKASSAGDINSTLDDRVKEASTLSEGIRIIREASELSRQQLAKWLGYVSGSIVRSWERDRDPIIPVLDVIIKICDEFNIDPFHLCTEETLSHYSRFTVRVGQVIAILGYIKGVTEKEIAQAIDRSEEYVISLTDGSRLPTLNDLGKMVHYFGVSREFFGEIKSSKEIILAESTLGGRIKMLRWLTDKYNFYFPLNQIDFSKLIGVGVVKVNQWENNRTMPTIAELAVLCEKYGMEIHEFCTPEAREFYLQQLAVEADELAAKQARVTALLRRPVLAIDAAIASAA